MFSSLTIVQRTLPNIEQVVYNTLDSLKSSIVARFHKMPRTKRWRIFGQSDYHFLGEGNILEKKVIKKTPLKILSYAQYISVFTYIISYDCVICSSSGTM